ncbi:hypothetical protein WISP_30807 [Willisornis vidua]|uniref:LIM zinc-binding domain-containing protein n=1 Tax=Willisornis vidua TaxID=1566151 RepID=A0ABQ9DK47_9PASS|nr:hypothetical protein WISP_30807 [Willisornis vidua]
MPRCPSPAAAPALRSFWGFIPTVPNRSASTEKPTLVSVLREKRAQPALPETTLKIPVSVPSHTGRPGLALCAGCGGRIQDPFLLRVSPDLEWHVACLKCAECGQLLDETCTCFLRDGKAYCKRDYSR